jgi:hypothetical protein
MKSIVKLMLILLTVWFSMLIGYWIIGRIIMPLEIYNTILSQLTKTAISIGVAVTWLWGWRKLAYHYFWQEINRQKETIPQTALNLKRNNAAS